MAKSHPIVWIIIGHILQISFLFLEIFCISRENQILINTIQLEKNHLNLLKFGVYLEQQCQSIRM